MYTANAACTRAHTRACLSVLGICLFCVCIYLSVGVCMYIHIRAPRLLERAFGVNRFGSVFLFDLIRRRVYTRVHRSSAPAAAAAAASGFWKCVFSELAGEYVCVCVYTRTYTSRCEYVCGLQRSLFFFFFTLQPACKVISISFLGGRSTVGRTVKLHFLCNFGNCCVVEL